MISTLTHNIHRVGWEILPTTPAADGARDDCWGRTSCAGTGTMIRPEAGDRNG